MTIGKKLYVNFGIILTMVLVLFLANWPAVSANTTPRSRRNNRRIWPKPPMRSASR